MNQSNLTRSICSILALSTTSIGLTFGGVALAQNNTDTTPMPKASGGGIEELIVTARREEEALSRVPLSIAVLGGDELAQRGISSQSDLQRGVPGLTIRTGQTDNSMTFTIRGQGIDTFSGSRPAVLAYFNEVPLSSYSASNFYDMQSIQVLKGPQGTLFGRNTTGGAVLYTAAMPSQQLEGFISGELGNYNHQLIQGAISLPISDTAGLRLATNMQWRDGWQENVLSGQDQGEVDRQAIRATLVVNPTDVLESVTLGSYSHSGGSSVGLIPYSIYDCGSTNNGVPLGSAAACLYGPLNPTYAAYQAANPGTTPGGLATLPALQRDLGHRKSYSPLKNYHNAEDWLFSNTTSYEISPELSFKNIFAYSRARMNDLYDSFGTGPYAVGWLYSTLDRQPGVVEGFTQEVDSYTLEPQFSGSALSDNLTYIVGGFLSKQKDYYRAAFKFFDFRPVFDPIFQTQEFETTDKTKAVYGQSTMDLSDLVTDGLQVTGGLRYTWEDVELKELPFSNAAGVDKETKSFKDPSWTIGLDYQINADLMVYIVNRGSFRAGGFSGTSVWKNAPGDQGGNLFDPEHVRDIEIGAKFAGTVGDMPARLNVAIYDSKITDVQRTLFVSIPASQSVSGSDETATVTMNIPSAKVSGVEIDGMIELFDGLQLGANVAYTDARYTDGRSEAFGSVYEYGPYADTPEWAGSVFAKVGIPVAAELGQMWIRGDMYAQSEMYFSNLYDTVAPDTRLSGYGIFNATAAWEGIMGTTLDATLFVKNAFQREYYTGGFGFPPLGINSAIPNEPRTFGVSLKYGF